MNYMGLTMNGHLRICRTDTKLTVNGNKTAGTKMTECG